MFVAFAALLFDGMELGLMPIAAGSVAKFFSATPSRKSSAASGSPDSNASLCVLAPPPSAASGWARSAIRSAAPRALGLGVLFYSIFCGLGYFAISLNQMLVLRFLVGLGVGGVGPMALPSSPNAGQKFPRPIVAGIMGAGLNSAFFFCHA